MKLQVTHVITTVENGGAENQLALLILEQVKNGVSVQIKYLKKATKSRSMLKDTNVPMSRISLRDFLHIRRGSNQPNNSYFQILHAHLPRAEVVAFFMSIITGNPLIISRHNTETFLPSFPGRVSRTLSQVISRKSRKVICISNTVRDFVISNQEISNPNKLETIYYGIREIRSQTSLKSEQIKETMSSVKIFTAARLTEQKNLLNLIRALEHLPKRFTLEIAGEGKLKETLEREIRNLGLPERVKLLGKIPEISKKLKECDVFAIASNYEGFGLVLLEAMKEGCKIAASRITVFMEILGADYEYLFDQSNPKDIATTIQSLSKDNQFNIDHWTERMKIFSIVETEFRTRRVYIESLLQK